LPPDATDIRDGDWLTSKQSGQAFRVTELDVPPQFVGLAIIKARYESKQAYEDRMATRTAGGTNITGGTFYGSNLNWGDQRGVEVSGTFDFSSIEREIGQRGGEDAEELRSALAEVRAAVEKGEPLKEGMLARFARAIREHSWFSSHMGQEIVKWLMQNPPPLV
jgi:hypothetical protein